METSAWTTARRVAPNGVIWYDLGSWLGPGINAAISTRHGGVSAGPFASLNLGGSVGDDPDRVEENRRRFAAALGLDPGSIAAAAQVHGNQVARLDQLPRPTEPAPAVDALMSDRPGVFARLLYADCVPILVAAPTQGAVGIAHGGWRGTQVGVAGELVRAMSAAYAIRPNQLRAVIGPSIGPCCYVVGPEVVRAFEESWADAAAYLRSTDAGAIVDLWEANRRQLVAAGLIEENILVSGACTRCQGDEYFSHRGQRGRAGRIAAIIGLTE